MGKRELGFHEKWLSGFSKRDFENGAFTDELTKKMRLLDAVIATLETYKCIGSMDGTSCPNKPVYCPHCADNVWLVR